MSEQTGWCLIPPHIVANKDFTASEKLLYGRIVGLTGKNGYCWASNYWLGLQIGINEKTVKNIIWSFKKKGLIETKVFRDDDNHITKRYIFMRGVPVEGLGGPVQGTSRSRRSDSYSVENSVEYSNTSRQSVKTEQHTDKRENYWLARRARNQAKKGRPLGSTYQPKPLISYEKKKKVYVDGRGVI